MQALRQKYLDACLCGDTITVVSMIKTEDLNFRNSKFLVECLKNACKGDQIEVCKIILGHRNTLKQFSYHELRDIVFNACKIGNLRIYQYYTDTTKHTFRQSEIFQAACEFGNLDLIEYILNAKNHPEKLSENFRDDLMLYACKSGYIEIVNFVISRGGDHWDWGLHGVCCSKNDNVEIAKIMIENGGLPSHECFESACFSGNINIVNLLIECGVDCWEKGMSSACRGGHINIVIYMIEKGATNWNRGMGQASQGGHLELVKFMISKGANDWNWGLRWGNCNYNMEIVKFMFLQGSTNFNNCLKCACFYGDLDFAKTMIEKGATYRNTGLTSACEGGHLELVQLMIDHGATNLYEGLLNNFTKNTNITMLLVKNFIKNTNIGVNDLECHCLKNSGDFKLLYMYNELIGNKNNNYMDLLPEYPPCVLFVGSRLTKLSQNNCHICHIKKLPVELFKMLVQY